MNKSTRFCHTNTQRQKNQAHHPAHKPQPNTKTYTTHTHMQKHIYKRHLLWKQRYQMRCPEKTSVSKCKIYIPKHHLNRGTAAYPLLCSLSWRKTQPHKTPFKWWIVTSWNESKWSIYIYIRTLKQYRPRIALFGCVSRIIYELAKRKRKRKRKKPES